MAKIDQTFTVAGTSRNDQGVKVRTSNTIMYVKALLKVEHTDIVLIELPSPMTKVEAIAFLKDLPEFASAEQQEAIDYFLDLKAPKAPKEPKVKKEKAAPVVLTDDEKAAENDLLNEEIVVDSELEDAPF
jgi:hypothetical protein